MFKERYGLNAGNILSPDEFLTEVCVVWGKKIVPAFLLSEPSTAITVLKSGHEIGSGYVVMEVQQPSGDYCEFQVHQSRIVK